MLKIQHLCRIISESKWKVFSVQVKEISVCHALQRRLTHPDYLDSDKSQLWFTTLPSRKKRAIRLNKTKYNKLRHNPIPTGEVIIECKNEKLNHHRGTYYGKFSAVPLASKTWASRKSNKDHFTILPTSEHPAFNFPGEKDIPLSFEAAGVCEEIINQINEMGITQPTVVQAKTIPKILQGEQVLVAAETGSGKTLAYLVPVIQKVFKFKQQNPQYKPGDNSPMAIILLNTRELSLQVGMIAEKLCSSLGLKCITIIGGKSKQLLEEPQFEPVDLVVSSVGILVKLTKTKVYSLSNCKFFVVDEADSLLDDTFRNCLKVLFRSSKMVFSPPHLQDVLENSAQLCLVSATMPTSIDTFGDFLPVEILQKVTTDYLHRIQPHVQQVFIRTGKTAKSEELLKVVKVCAKEKLPTMIFCNTTKSCNWVTYFLVERGIEAVRVNSGMFPNERLREFEKFKCGEVDFICCTDVSSRGLDCTRVKRVINFDFPKYMADYIHRCGRTGRIGHTENCKVINFVDSMNQAYLVNEIEKAARTQRIFHNVNNNIKRIIKHKALKHSEGTTISKIVLSGDELETNEEETAASA